MHFTMIPDRLEQRLNTKRVLSCGFSHYLFVDESNVGELAGGLPPGGGADLFGEEIVSREPELLLVIAVVGIHDRFVLRRSPFIWGKEASS